MQRRQLQRRELQPLTLGVGARRKSRKPQAKNLRLSLWHLLRGGEKFSGRLGEKVSSWAS
jgi:hypothetical protein